MRLPLLSCVILLAACGSGGGGGGLPPAAQASSLPPVTTPAPEVFGSRALPGYDIQVRRLTPVQAGQSLALAAVITAEPEMTVPVLVEGAIANGEPDTWIAAVLASDGSWTWTASLPADLTGLRAWIRVTDPAGNQSQSGPEDFALSH